MSHFPRFSVISPYPRSYSEFFSICTFFSISYQIPGLTVSVSHFPLFSVFSPNSISYSEFFSICTFFSVSCHIPTYIFRVSLSTLFSFLPTFQVIECLCLIFQVFHFPHHNPGTTLYIFHFSLYSPFFALFL